MEKLAAESLPISHIRKGQVCPTFEGKDGRTYLLRNEGPIAIIAEVIEPIEDQGELVRISYERLYEDYYDLPGCLELPRLTFASLFGVRLSLITNDNEPENA